MLIALDYDGTYTADPGLWDLFITSAIARGHEIEVVTMRHPHEPIKMPIPVVYTGRQAKRQFVEALGRRVQIWIDDNPHWIYQDAL